MISDSRARAALKELTPAELGSCITGAVASQMRELAEKLTITINTVAFHRRNIRQKLHSASYRMQPGIPTFLTYWPILKEDVKDPDKDCEGLKRRNKGKLETPSEKTTETESNKKAGETTTSETPEHVLVVHDKLGRRDWLLVAICKLYFCTRYTNLGPVRFYFASQTRFARLDLWSSGDTTCVASGHWPGNHVGPREPAEQLATATLVASRPLQLTAAPIQTTQQNLVRQILLRRPKAQFLLLLPRRRPGQHPDFPSFLRQL